MGVRGQASPSEESLANSAVEKASATLSPQVCYVICDVICGEDYVDLGFGRICSNSLKKLLENCGSAIVFAATSGAAADRLISTGKAMGVSTALAFDAAATAFTESLCDSFCEHITETLTPAEALTMRFSPGYGDVPLDLQKDIFRILDCPKNIGLTLTDSLLMVPSKSVTAIMGITHNNVKTPEHHCTNHGKCSGCNMKTCIYRKEENQ